MKAKIALGAIKGQKTAKVIAAEYEVHPTQISHWKKQGLDGLPEVFSMGKSKQEHNEEALIGRTPLEAHSVFSGCGVLACRVT